MELFLQCLRHNSHHANLRRQVQAHWPLVPVVSITDGDTVSQLVFVAIGSVALGRWHPYREFTPNISASIVTRFSRPARGPWLGDCKRRGALLTCIHSAGIAQWKSRNRLQVAYGGSIPPARSTTFKGDQPWHTETAVADRRARAAVISGRSKTICSRGCG